MRQACAALAEAHASGLIHRDVKPANVYATRQGRRYDIVKVLDFGMVKPVGGDLKDSGPTLTFEGNLRGTPVYMSPEQAVGELDIDQRSDIYGLGALAYELLTGRPPFDGANVPAVLVAVVHDAAVPPSRLRPEVPGDLEKVVLRCLAKRAEDRFPDAYALEDALLACSDSSSWDAKTATEWWLARSQPLSSVSQR
jgi:serine/threonine-protein kinase